MTTSLTRTELDFVKKSISDAELGQATLEELARAHSIAERSGGGVTVGIIRKHIRDMTPSPASGQMLVSLVTGVLSGVIVWLLLGRRGKVDFT